VTDRKPIVVMKFGGTSVADETARAAVANRVQAALELGHAPVLVVSAMGRKGAPYATDTLLDLIAPLPTDAREKDLLASVGEVVSAVVVAGELRAAGIDAVAFTGAEAGILTDGVAGDAAITEIHTGALLAAIDEGKVPVIAGFQGVAEDGSLTTLGRGGSDTTACAMGVALKAEEVGIYTDVDGVMTADPRACEHAEVVEVISAEELFQMARSGCRVVHTPAAELALSSGLTVRVRNTFSDHDGTFVTDIAGYRPNSVATAISHVTGIARMRVALGADEGSLGHMAAQTRVYRAMADAGVSLDMFTPVGDSLVFTVRESVLDHAAEVIHNLALLHQSHRGLAKVTLVGAGMHGVPGVMARIAESLTAAGVDIYQAADSHTTISVLIPAEQTEIAVAALHNGFELGASVGESAQPTIAMAPVGTATSTGAETSNLTNLARERFGARSAEYRDSSVHAAGDDLDRLISLVAPQPGDLALDVATGAGHTALALAHAGASVIASDITLEMLAEAIDNITSAGQRAETAVADAHDLPFDESSFDVVTARMAPHHFVDPARFVSQVARVLRPGGRFGLEDQVAPPDPDAAAVINQFEAIRDPSHNRQLPVAEWEQIAREAGLEVVVSEVFAKDVDFDWWTSIQDVSAEDRANISALLAAGPPAAREWYVPDFAETGLVRRFRSPHLIMLAIKPE
jgi:aspartate kinase